MMWEMCRICADISASLLPIFQKEGGHSNLDLKIKKCLSINVTENDAKPKQICFACITKLEDFSDFYDMCHSSNYKFESLLYTCSTNLQNASQNAEDPLLLIRSGWDTEKSGLSNSETNTMIQPTDRVIVVSKLNEQQNLNQDCQDILLMVQLKYDGSQNIQEKQTDLPQQTQQQSVLRHSDEYNKEWKSQQSLQNTDKKSTVEPKTPETTDHSVQKQIANISPEAEITFSSSKPQETKTKKPFSCMYCDKSFMRRSSLNAHVSNHTNIKPFSCSVCDKSFAIRWDLTVHQRLHTGVFMCDFCKKVFAVKGKLERHKRIHTGEKPFVCPVKGCGKSFSDKRNLESHKESHTDNRPFPCKQCDKKFKTKSHLTDHQRVHSLETLFTCETCGRSFKWKGNLKIHVKNGSCTKSKTNKIDVGS